MLFANLISIFKTRSKVSLKTKLLGLIGHVKGINNTAGSKDRFFTSICTFSLNICHFFILNFPKNLSVNCRSIKKKKKKKKNREKY